MRRSVPKTRVWTLTASLALAAGVVAAPVTFHPAADGTLADGVPYGPRDGTADAADWTFNESSPGYEGTIALVNDAATGGFEYRLVFEYDLATLATSPPVSAELSFMLRGAPRFPAPPAVVHVYVYPADLLERNQDFSAGPAVLVGSATVQPYQPRTLFRLNVSEWTNNSLQSGAKKLAFRFQIDPQTPYDQNQAFLDARDADKATKPALNIDARVPGDADFDRDVDLDDAATFMGCLRGPGVTATTGCRVFDFDLDDDVDLSDASVFLELFPTP